MKKLSIHKSNDLLLYLFVVCENNKFLKDFIQKPGNNKIIRINIIGTYKLKDPVEGKVYKPE